MAILGALALAGLGGMVGGNIGMAIGWMIGSWLFGPKAKDNNQIFDPGAEEMPRINQSLRGATMNILFGTNRVGSNIVWTKNFRTIRHETKDSAGGGKGGGSGMMKGGGSSSTEVTYEYKWDMLFHLGMGPEPYSIFGGWVGSERMNDDTLDRILQGATQSDGYFKSSVNRENKADLQFADAYFGFGGAADDPTVTGGYSNWAYFEAQEGYPCRWPSTYYVGFQQLNLGSSARVPQLSWEIGPGQVNFTYTKTFLSQYKTSTLPTYGGNWQSLVSPGTLFMKNLTGTTTDPVTGVKTAIGGTMIYGFNTTVATHAFSLIRADTSAVIKTFAVADFQTEAVALGLDETGAYVYDQDVCLIPIPNTEYYYVHGRDIVGGLESMHAVILYRLNADFTSTRIGGRSYRSNVPQNQIVSDRIHAISRWGQGEDTDEIVIAITCVAGGSHKPKVLWLPPTDEIENVNVIIDSSVAYNWDVRNVDLSSTDLFGLNAFDCNTYRTSPYAGGVFFLPNLQVDIQPFYTMYVCVYVGYPEIKKHTDLGNGATGNCSVIEKIRDGTIVSTGIGDDFDTTAWPKAFVMSCELGRNSISHVITQINYRKNMTRDFLDKSDNTLIGSALDTTPGWSDSAQHSDGTAGDITEDWMGPNVIPLTGDGTAASQLFLILFPYLFIHQTPDLEPLGTRVKVRAFIWQPYAEKAKLYASQQGVFADLVADVGLTEVNRYTNVPRSIIPWYDPPTEKIYVFAAYKSSDPITDRFVIGQIGSIVIGGGTDVAPPYIIYTILTNTTFGFSYDPDRIDQASYLAALQYCEDEGIVVSTQYNREDNFLSVIDELLSLYGGFLIESGGNIRFGVQQFSSAPVRVIDNDHLVIENDGDAPVAVTKGARQDGFNYVKVNFFNRDLEYRQDFVEISDEVDMDFNGVRAKEFQPKFVMSPETAYKIAERALWTNLYARDVYNFKLGWKDADIEPGDVITLIDSFHYDLQTGAQVRIVRWQEKSRGVFDCMAVQEVEYAMSSTRSFFDVKSVSGGNTILQNVAAPLDFRMYELPQEFQGSAANLYVGYNQGSIVMGAYLYASPDNITYSLVGNMQPYIISGMWGNALPEREPGFVEENVHFFIAPQSGFDYINSPVYAQTMMLDDVSESTRAVGAGVFIQGSEAISVEGLTLIDQNHYKARRLYRGWGGTHIQAHNSGAYFHKHGGGMFVQELNQDRVGTTVYYKVVPYNFAGIQYAVDSIDPKVYVIGGDYWKVRPLPDASIFVASLVTGTASDNIRGLTTRAVSSGGSDLTLTWPRASVTKGSGAGGYGKGGYGDFTADVATPYYRVEVLSANLAVVRSTVVNTQLFTYTRATNSADFNGAAKAFGVRVTPYNSYGDAPDDRTYTLNLFW